MTKEYFKRVNVLIRPDQHQKVHELNLSLSGLVRDLLDDRFSDHKMILSVTPKTKQLYDTIISNFGVADSELEHFIVRALDRFLEEKVKEIELMRQELRE